MNAYEELIEELEDGEEVESIVFGAWGWGCGPSKDGEWELGYSEPDPPPVPFEKRGKILTLHEAEPMMRSWSFIGGFGAPECYATNVYTNRRIVHVYQYDGATGFSSIRRSPTEGNLPDMPGG